MLPKEIIPSIRFGLATNSSSSHSIIHSPDVSRSRADETSGEYGWEFFTLTSKEEKANYMNAQLIGCINYYHIEILSDILENAGHSEAVSYLGGLHVDHESQMIFPYAVGNNNISMEFFNAYRRYIIDHNFVILGGNDNTDNDHKLSQEDDGKKSYYDDFLDKDTVYANGNYWVIQNRERKLRIQFNGEHPVATRPELIDLKITDFCDIGCSFCYQDSTAEGIHADLGKLSDIIRQFSGGTSATEFAIGGGEPTQYPEFINILTQINYFGGIANFTTKSTKWFEDSEIVRCAQKNVSGIAYSVSTAQEAKKFFDLHLEAFYNSGTRKPDAPEAPAFYLHIIPEIMPHEDIREIISYAEETNPNWKIYKPKINITMLGFKSIGRGEDMEYNIIPEIIQMIQMTKHTAIGIDTKFASDYQSVLDDAGIDPRLFTTEEGEYSMYIDAVKELAYKSSWHLDTSVSLTKQGTSRYVRNRSALEVFKDIKEI